VIPPLTKAATAATPKRAAMHGITIPQIAPVDNPLLLFFEIGITVLYLLDSGKLLFKVVVGLSVGVPPNFDCHLILNLQIHHQYFLLMSGV
jgi:hypothetical protein